MSGGDFMLNRSASKWDGLRRRFYAAVVRFMPNDR